MMPNENSRLLWAERWYCLIYHLRNEIDELLLKHGMTGARALSNAISQAMGKLSSTGKASQLRQAAGELVEKIANFEPDVATLLRKRCLEAVPDKRELHHEFVKVLHDQLGELNEIVIDASRKHPEQRTKSPEDASKRERE